MSQVALNGVLEFVDVGTGAWRLRTDDGEQVQLLGGGLTAYAGRRVRVVGAWFEGMTLGMVGGRALQVVRIVADG